jgi:hypothetical protein
MRQLLQVANPVAGFLYHISMHAFVHSNFRIDDFAQEISMQYCGSEYTIELGWSVTIVWCKQSRRMQNCPRRPLSTTHFHLMETLRVRLLWIGIVRILDACNTRFDVRVPDDPDKGCPHRSGQIIAKKAMEKDDWASSR